MESCSHTLSILSAASLPFWPFWPLFPFPPFVIIVIFPSTVSANSSTKGTEKKALHENQPRQRFNADNINSIWESKMSIHPLFIASCTLCPMVDTGRPLLRSISVELEPLFCFASSNVEFHQSVRQVSIDPLSAKKNKSPVFMRHIWNCNRILRYLAHNFTVISVVNRQLDSKCPSSSLLPSRDLAIGLWIVLFYDNHFRECLGARVRDWVRGRLLKLSAMFFIIKCQFRSANLPLDFQQQGGVRAQGT